MRFRDSIGCLLTLNLGFCLTVCGQADPSITTSPSSYNNVNVHDPFTFTVQAAGTEPLQYQWKFNNSDITSATNSSFTITNVVLLNGGNYDVIVSNISGSITSAPAILRVLAIGPDVTNVTGKSATLTVQIAPEDEFLTWKKKGDPDWPQTGFSDGSRISGTQTELNIDRLCRRDAGEYYVSLPPNFQSKTLKLAVADGPDFNGDRKTDIVWQHTDGRVAAWLMDGTNHLSTIPLGTGRVYPSWRLNGVFDVDGDGNNDLIWRNTNGLLAAWFMDGTNILRSASLNPGQPVSKSWRLCYFDELGYTKGRTNNYAILWQDLDGRVGVWSMNGTNRIDSHLNSLFPLRLLTRARFFETNRFFSAGQTCWLGLNENGIPGIDPTALLNGGHPVSKSWHIAGSADLNYDGFTDLIWQNTNGLVAVWLMKGTNPIDTFFLNDGRPIGPGWKIVAPR
jgi:hypothetical protein